MNFRRRRRQVDTLEMTPLIDVIFQLLIFFLLTTTFVTSPGISIERPKAKNSGPLDTDRLTIVIPKDAKGTVMFRGKSLTIEALRQTLAKIFKKDPKAQIAIDADEQVKHRNVVKIMDLIEGVGFRRIGIVTSPAPPAAR